jgi:hypothetical protein
MDGRITDASKRMVVAWLGDSSNAAEEAAAAAAAAQIDPMDSGSSTNAVAGHRFEVTFQSDLGLPAAPAAEQFSLGSSNGRC